MTKIGDSAFDVYPLCLGTNTFGWTSNVEESHGVLDDYFAAGGNFIDTADVYPAWAEGCRGGEAEEILGQWLAPGGRRDQIILATKVAKLSPNTGLSRDSIINGAEASLSRLNTSYIDLYYAHNQDDSVPVEESVEAFAFLQKAGKIREVGLSNFSAAKIAEWIAAADKLGMPRPIALQPHYNLLARDEFETELRSVAEEFNLGVVPYLSLASGLLTGKYQRGQEITGERAGRIKLHMGARSDAVVAAVVQISQEHNVEPASIAIAWLLQQPTVVAPIASARVPAQLPALLEGVSLVLSTEELEMLDSVSQT